MVDLASGGMRFDTGIERVSRQDAFGDARLPETASILPSREQLRAELDQVVPQPRLAGLLDSFMAPDIRRLDMLLPDGFRAHFQDLRELVAQRRGRNEPELEEAGRLLADEQGTRDLLDAYRNTLLGA
ncbi:MAG TPA: hypothetical protein VFG43_02380 [Geminicoccaceae bacterium]|nr:hypothetical protein [Geminicoccaceae bacterium]